MLKINWEILHIYFNNNNAYRELVEFFSYLKKDVVKFPDEKKFNLAVKFIYFVTYYDYRVRNCIDISRVVDGCNYYLSYWSKYKNIRINDLPNELIDIYDELCENMSEDIGRYVSNIVYNVSKDFDLEKIDFSNCFDTRYYQEQTFDSKYGEFELNDTYNNDYYVCECPKVKFARFYDFYISLNDYNDIDKNVVMDNLDYLFNNANAIVEGLINEMFSYCQEWQEVDQNGNSISLDYIKNNMIVLSIDVSKNDATIWALPDKHYLLGGHNVNYYIDFLTKKVEYKLEG